MGVKELVIRTRQGEGMKKVRTNHERLTMGDMEGMKKVRTNHERLTMGDMEEMTVDISGALNLPLLALSYLSIGNTGSRGGVATPYTWLGLPNLF